MLQIHSRLRMIWNHIFTPLDPVLLQASWRSELLLARGRVAVIAILILLIAVRFSSRVNSGIDLGFILLVAVVGLVIALWLERASTKRRPQPRLGMLSSLLDVTLLSSVLLAMALTGSTSGAVNSRVIFSVYFLIILSTTLRFSPSICLAVGLAVEVQYGLVVALAYSHPMRDLGSDVQQYGTFVLVEQIYRLILLAIGSVLAMATVVRARGLLESSARDGLTGLLNRRFLDARLEEEVERASRENSPLAVALLDVDDFKQFNDRWGHPAGDEALRSFARTLLATFRASDVVTRYGGEEFAILMPGADRQAALVRLNTALAKFRSLRLLDSSEASPVSLTASCGLVDFGDSQSSATAAKGGESSRAVANRLIGAADELLLIAKSRGKDQVTVSGDQLL